MLLGFLIIFSVCGNTVKSQSSTVSISTKPSTGSIATTKEMLPPLLLKASPDYPVAAGQQVQLTCSAPSISVFVTWYWNILQNNSWTKVGPDKEDLTLTRPEDSGLYQCVAETTSQKSVSQSHTVFIVSFQDTAVETLGKPALVLSVLNLIIIVAAFLWFGYRRYSEPPPNTSNPPKEAVPRPQVVPKVHPPSCDADGDVYMNYAGSNPAYTDLDPAKMTTDNLYSTLS